MQEGSGERSGQKEISCANHGLIALRRLQGKGVPTTLGEVAKASGVGKIELAKCYRQLVNQLDLKIPVACPAEYVARVASRVNVGAEVQVRALEILSRAEKAGVAAGKDPIGFAASTLYIATSLERERLTQKRAGYAAGVKEATIRKDTCASGMLSQSGDDMLRRKSFSHEETRPNGGLPVEANMRQTTRQRRTPKPRAQPTRLITHIWGGHDMVGHPGRQKQKAPKTIFPVPYVTGIELDISLIGPIPLDEWDNGPDSFLSRSLDISFRTVVPAVTMLAPHAPLGPGAAVPAPEPALDASTFAARAVAFPAASVSVSVNCKFTDESSKHPYGDAPGALSGNHGHYSAKLQQLQVDLQGNLLPDPRTGRTPWWADVDSKTGFVLTNGTTASLVADLYGPGATEEYSGNNPVAQPNQSARASLELPINLTSVLSIYRIAYSYYLGDTRGFGRGPCQETGVPGEEGPRPTAVPNDGSEWAYSQGFQLIVLPSDFVQLKFLPMGLIYVPPGSKSNESFQYNTTYTNTVTISDPEDNVYSVANNLGTSIVFIQGSTPGAVTGQMVSTLGAIAGGISPITFNLTKSDTTHAWDTTTTPITNTRIENDTTITLPTSSINQYTASGSLALPGDTAPPSEQPFWGDTFLLMVHPQFAIWDYGSAGPAKTAVTLLSAMQLLSSWQSYAPVSVEELNDVDSGAQPSLLITGEPPATGGPPATLVLYPSDCIDLLSLDPFWVAGWQGASLEGSRWVAAGSYAFGTQQWGPNPTNKQVPPRTGVSVKLQSVTSSETDDAQTTTLKVTGQIQTRHSFTQSQLQSYNYNLNVVGLSTGGSGSSNNPGSTASTATTSMAATFQSRTQEDIKNARTIEGSLDDQPPTLLTKDVSDAGQNVLTVNSTEGAAVAQVIVIHPAPSQKPADTEAGTVASIQDGISLTLEAPLLYKHESGEEVVPMWSYMTVNAYTDIAFGGLAFQDPNAQKPTKATTPPEEEDLT